MSLPFDILGNKPYEQKRMEVLKSLDRIQRELMKIDSIACRNPGRSNGKLVDVELLTIIQTNTQLMAEWVLNHNQKSSL